MKAMRGARQGYREECKPPRAQLSALEHLGIPSPSVLKGGGGNTASCKEPSPMPVEWRHHHFLQTHGPSKQWLMLLHCYRVKRGHWVFQRKVES